MAAESVAKMDWQLDEAAWFEEQGDRDVGEVESSGHATRRIGGESRIVETERDVGVVEAGVQAELQGPAQHEGNYAPR